jgi:hypothetical protein
MTQGPARNEVPGSSDTRCGARLGVGVDDDLAEAWGHQ